MLDGPAGGGGGPAPPPPPPGPPPPGGEMDQNEQVGHYGPTEYKGSIISSDPPPKQRSSGIDLRREVIDVTVSDPPRVYPPPPTEPPPKYEPPQINPEEPAQQPQGADPGFEVCCVGFNPEDSKLEAIIRVDRTKGFGSYCSMGKQLHVGFWLQSCPPGVWTGANPIDPTWKFAGEGSVFVFGVDTSIKRDDDGIKRYSAISPLCTDKIIHYAVHCLLSTEFVKFITDCESTILPKVYCLATVTPRNWATTKGQFQSFDVVDFNFNGNGLKLPFWHNRLREPSVQFPKRSQYGSWKLIMQDENPASLSKVVWGMHASHTKGGKILLFSGTLNDDFRIPTEEVSVRDATALFDPATDSIQNVNDAGFEVRTWYSINNPDYDPNKPKGKDNPEYIQKANRALSQDLFCAGHSVLPNGDIFAAGGTDNSLGAEQKHEHHGHFLGLNQVSIFNSDTNTWCNAVQNMRHGRWYPSTLVLGDGRIFIMDGHTDYFDLLRHSNLDIEIYDPFNQNWDYEYNGNASVGDPSIVDDDGVPQHGSYPRLFLLPNGFIFCATPLREYRKDPLFQKGSICFWNPQLRQWVPAGFPQKFGCEFGEPGVLLPLRFPDYTAEILIWKDGEKTTYIASPLENKAGWLKNKTFAKRRSDANMVLLADGSVMLLGGFGDLKKGPPDDEKHLYLEFANREVDIFDPYTKIWTKGAPISIGRRYHSTAILLYDGRVLVAGSQHEILVNESGTDKAKTKYELSLEIYTPDYLWRGPRPTYVIDRIKVGVGQFLRVKLTGGWNYGMIGRIALVRHYTVTHSFAYDQRYVELEAVKLTDIESTEPAKPDTSDVEFYIKIPFNNNLVPPGPYMLFILGKTVEKVIAGQPAPFIQTGAPSIAQINTIT